MPQCLKGFAAHGIIVALKMPLGIGGTGSGCIFDGEEPLPFIFSKYQYLKRESTSCYDTLCTFVLEATVPGEVTFPFCTWASLLHVRLHVVLQFQNCSADCFCLIDIVFFTVLIKYFFCVDINSRSHAADFGTVGRTPHFGSQSFTSYFWLTKV